MHKVAFRRHTPRRLAFPRTNKCSGVLGAARLQTLRISFMAAILCGKNS